MIRSPFVAFPYQGASASFLGRVAVTVLLFALAWPAVAAAQDDAFRRGLEARDDEKWDDVVTQMEEAIKNDPTDSTRRVGGGFLRGSGTEYFPHYFLGEALFNKGLCARAVEQWSISQEQGAIKVRREFANRIENGYKECAARGVLAPVEFNQQLAASTQAVADATAMAKRVTELAPGDVWSPEIHEQYARAGSELTAAQARLAAGTSSRVAAHFAEARTAAGRAVTALRAVESSLNASIENLTAVRRQVREVDQIIAAAETGDRSIDGVKAELTPELSASRQSGRDLLARARERTRTGEKTQSLATVNEALRSAQDAASVFKDVLDRASALARDAVEREWSGVLLATGEALSLLDASVATLVRRVTGRPAGSEMTSRLDAFQKRASTIRRRYDTAQKTQNINGLKDTTRLALEARSALEALISSLGPLTLGDRGVHPALEEGSRLFFAGEYQQGLNALDTRELDDAPLQMHVHLFRAAALYYLFLRSGEKDQTLRTRAAAEVEACKRIDAAFTPDPRAFAPRFLQFFQNAAAPVTP